tara:strand:+ start:52 stop:1137 length:1086 start_codon:yes stop_codon:yes gene_type:complete
MKEAYESGEIRTDRQVSDFRHGVRSAEGSLNGELSAAAYSDFMGSIVGKDFVAVTLGAAAQITVTVSGTTFTLVRATGSFLTDGVKVGMVIRATGLTATADNSRNLLVASLSATEAVVVPLNNVALTAQAAGSSVTVTSPGKQTFVPATAHTDDSYTVEEFYADIAQSEVYTGMKLNSMAIQLPATGLTTVDFAFAGKDLTQTGTSQYFTSPTAQSSNGIFAAVNGVMLVDGAAVALVTSADFSVERATENATAVGSNSVSEIFTGRIRVTGNLSVYFQDEEFRGYFDSETPVSIVLTLTADSTATSNFITFTLPKVKLGSFTKDDNELGLIASSSFQALLNDVTTGGLPATTIQIQDSAA